MADVSLYGRLTKDPEIRQVGDKTVAVFSVADGDYFYQKKDTEKQSLYFDCEAWGRQADTVQSFFNKGNRIKVSGQLCPNNFTGKTGEVVKRQVLRVDRVTLVESKSESQSRGGGGGNLFDSEIPF
jgi:single-strand DNA-binding protein|tara:strand:+ start:952 stop:1329 length:378 start_codon:yes stop_codon:yes gene_type:complete